MSIIHSYCPSNSEEYLQESGRAGRDGKQSYAFVLLSSGDSGEIAGIFRSKTCRRIGLLKALGQEKETCTGCDVCNKKVITQPYGYRQITKLIKRHPFRYTASKAAGILSGSRCIYGVNKTDRRNPFYNTLQCDEDMLERSIENMNFGTLKIKDKTVLYDKGSKVNNLTALLFEKFFGKT